MVGIPGTVGGALHGNSGGRATDVGDWTHSVTVLTRSGELRTLAKNEMTFSYRSSSVDELAIVNATFQLETESREELVRRMQKLWIVKRSRQPSGDQSTGCLFKDPLGVSASEIIEQADLKSASVGGARLFERDPNFVTLSDDASTADVVALIDQIREKISQQLGVELESSLQIW